MTEENKGAKVEVTTGKEPDFFNYEDKKDPKYHYHWAENDPRRIEELRRKGYEIDPAATSKGAAQKVDNQRKFLERTLKNEKARREDKDMAKEMLDRMGDGKPIDTVACIPGHIPMRTPIENRRKIMEKRQRISESMGEKIQQDVQDLNKALQRSGKGGIKAFQDLFDKIKDR